MNLSFPILAKAPFVHRALSTRRIMLELLWVLVPVIALYDWAWGVGWLIKLLVAVCIGLGTEYAVLRLQKHTHVQALDRLQDLSAVLSVVLLWLSLPPQLPLIWLLVGVVFALAVVKGLYGGLGRNLFNPAMAGFVIISTLAPEAMHYPAWPSLLAGASPHSSIQSAGGFAFDWPAVFSSLHAGLTFDHSAAIDAQSGATALSNLALSNTPLPPLAGAELLLLVCLFVAWLWMSYRRLIDQRLVFGFVLGALLASVWVWLVSDTPGFGASLLRDMARGGIVIGAVFYITDPVSAPLSAKARVIYAMLAGLLSIWIRHGASLPDGVAYGILLANFTGPLLDRLLISRPPAA